jgi:hypothetical protein
MSTSGTTDFVTVDEAAQLAGISHWTVRTWLTKGFLTRYKSASRTVVSRAEILERTRPVPVMVGQPVHAIAPRMPNV